MGLTGGTISWTARVSVVRRNLKEAAGKTLAQRTETRYEAFVLDEEAYIFKVRYLYGMYECRSGGHKREGGCALPGEICSPAERLNTSRGVLTGEQKSAEGIVSRPTRLKAGT
jgi:hypothetical protein